MSERGRVLWVTGGGSGMGRATALAAAAAGWRVAVSGRRTDAVEAVVETIESRGGVGLAVTADVRDPLALAAAHSGIVAEWGAVDALVASAGLNSPKRAWADQRMDDVVSVIDTNLTAVMRAIDLVTPGMRETGRGSIVVVSSRAAWRFSPGSGVAYMASKSALQSVCASLNDQEGVNGIAACHLCPGDVDSEFLELRPEVPSTEARKAMLTPDDVARSVMFVLDSPRHVRIDELVITPVGQR